MFSPTQITVTNAAVSTQNPAAASRRAVSAPPKHKNAAAHAPQSASHSADGTRKIAAKAPQSTQNSAAKRGFFAKKLHKSASKTPISTPVKTKLTTPAFSASASGSSTPRAAHSVSRSALRACASPARTKLPPKIAHSAAKNSIAGAKYTPFPNFCAAARSSRHSSPAASIAQRSGTSAVSPAACTSSPSSAKNSAAPPKNAHTIRCRAAFAGARSRRSAVFGLFMGCAPFQIVSVSSCRAYCTASKCTPSGVGSSPQYKIRNAPNRRSAVCAAVSGAVSFVM